MEEAQPSSLLHLTTVPLWCHRAQCGMSNEASVWPWSCDSTFLWEEKTRGWVYVYFRNANCKCWLSHSFLTDQPHQFLFLFDIQHPTYHLASFSEQKVNAATPSIPISAPAVDFSRSPDQMAAVLFHFRSPKLKQPRLEKGRGWAPALCSGGTVLNTSPIKKSPLLQLREWVEGGGDGVGEGEGVPPGATLKCCKNLIDN